MGNWLAQHLEETPDLARLPVYKRSRHSLHMRQRDGTVVAEFTGRPMHYQDEHGIWQPLDTSLRQIGNEYGAPGLDVFISVDGDVRVAGTKHRQKTGRFVILDVVTGKVKHVHAKLGQAYVEGDSVLRDAGTYQHRLRVTPTGMRETLIINEPLSGTSAAEWAMLETEIVGRSLPDGWLDGLNWAGKYQFRPPTCTDANGVQIAAKQYALKQGNRQMLFTGVPLAWLTGAAYPVVLDPDFTDGTADGLLQSMNADYTVTRNTCSGFFTVQSTINIGQAYWGGKSPYYEIDRGILLFNTASISPATVFAAALRLAPQGSYASLPDTIEITKLNWSAWNPISAGNQEAAYDAALIAVKDVNWQVAGAAVTGNVYYESAALSSSWIATSGTTYYGLLAYKDRVGTAPSTNEYIGISPSEWTYPPILRVIYGTPPSGGAVSISPLRGNIG